MMEFFFVFGGSRFGVFCEPGFLFRDVFIEGFLRKGIGETPRDEEGGFRALPVRETAAVDLG